MTAVEDLRHPRRLHLFKSVTASSLADIIRVVDLEFGEQGAADAELKEAGIVEEAFRDEKDLYPRSAYHYLWHQLPHGSDAPGRLAVQALVKEFGTDTANGFLSVPLRDHPTLASSAIAGVLLRNKETVKSRGRATFIRRNSQPGPVSAASAPIAPSKAQVGTGGRQTSAGEARPAVGAAHAKVASTLIKEPAPLLDSEYMRLSGPQKAAFTAAGGRLICRRPASVEEKEAWTKMPRLKDSQFAQLSGRQKAAFAKNGGRVV